MKARVALIDDHVLLRKGLANLVEDLGHQVIFQADHGKDLQQHLPRQAPPDVILMDINMPVMDGYEAALWLRQHHPEIKVIALSMYDDEKAIIRMLKNGARGYLLKDSDPTELNAAISAVMQKGFYHSELVTGKLLHSINTMQTPASSKLATVLGLTEKEREFLKLVCTEMTYREIADQMGLSHRTIDGYRDILFDKLDIKSRVGLAIFAIKNDIVQV